MRPTILGVILAMLAFCNKSNADTLTYYNNEAAWEAALAGYEIGPYTGTVTITDTFTTLTPGSPLENGLMDFLYQRE
jgi:hypothetical protein